MSNRDEHANRLFVIVNNQMVLSFHVYRDGHLNAYAVLPCGTFTDSMPMITDDEARRLLREIFGPLDFARKALQVAA